MRRTFFPIVAVLAFNVGAAAQEYSDPTERFGAHGVGHAQGHDIYKKWSPPNNPGTSCCDNSDCRPTKADIDKDGHWLACNGTRWLRVPRERVLAPNLAGDGRSHLCEKDEFIYCFTPGEIRS